MGKSSAPLENILKQFRAFCGLLVAVAHTIVHPLKQDVNHESATE
jgi:hypothetical protein